MFVTYEVLQEIYKNLYSEVKKDFIRSKEVSPFALIYTSDFRLASNGEAVDLGSTGLRITPNTSKFGTTFEVSIDNSSKESIAHCFTAIQVFAVSVKANFVIIVSEINYRKINESKSQEAVEFSIQSQDGSYKALAEIFRKGKKVRIPDAPPSLSPVDIRFGLGKIF